MLTINEGAVEGEPLAEVTNGRQQAMLHRNEVNYEVVFWENGEPGGSYFLSADSDGDAVRKMVALVKRRAEDAHNEAMAAVGKAERTFMKWWHNHPSRPDCGTCGGSGLLDTGYECGYCDGEGTDEDEPGGHCGFCAGSGEAKTICEDCQATGKEQPSLRRK